MPTQGGLATLPKLGNGFFSYPRSLPLPEGRKVLIPSSVCLGFGSSLCVDRLLELVSQLIPLLLLSEGLVFHVLYCKSFPRSVLR